MKLQPVTGVSRRPTIVVISEKLKKKKSQVLDGIGGTGGTVLLTPYSI
jgi:hypothetical protein